MLVRIHISTITMETVRKVFKIQKINPTILLPGIYTKGNEISVPQKWCIPMFTMALFKRDKICNVWRTITR